jgi:Cu(I)/Ag(I) efflux system membrane protein CusA/SilA
LLRGFPEVESVIGKAGRADTPTDPAPLDMVETFVNFRPKELWPKRVIKYPDAAAHTTRVLDELQRQGFLSRAATTDDHTNLINEATQKAIERFDEEMRDLALARYQQVEHDLERELTHFCVAETIHRIEAAGRIKWPKGMSAVTVTEKLAAELTSEHGRWLARNPALEDVTQLTRDVVARLKADGAIDDEVVALQLREPWYAKAWSTIGDFFGRSRNTFATTLLEDMQEVRSKRWRARVKEINWELFDRGTEAYNDYALNELAMAAAHTPGVKTARRYPEVEKLAQAALAVQLDRPFDAAASQPFNSMAVRLQATFADKVFFWPRQTGPKGDLVDDEMSRVLQVPGWSNIFTQPIINRIEMLSTGVRTDIGVKVFGPDLDTIDGVCKQIESLLQPINGARNVIAAPIMGKGYVHIDINRQHAARYGISVEDVQNEIEVALAGRAVTFTVEQRERFPVRIRYAREYRTDEESIRRLLISPGGMSSVTTGRDGQMATSESMSNTIVPSSESYTHSATPAHAGRGKTLIPLSAVATVEIVEGPAMIKSENGRLLNYVTLNVRGRDIVGFVDEAQRVVSQKVRLPEGVHIEWSGEFDHQIRAARTLLVIFPAVFVLIFVILYLTYKDLWDAALMMLTVPEALAGGAFFMYLFPKIINGWDAPPMDFSVAVWVGFIACFGRATETGIIMLVYLREAIEKRGGLENL